MKVLIDKENSKNLAEILKEMLKKSRKEGDLCKHYGKLKRNIDGLKYQTAIRRD